MKDRRQVGRNNSVQTDFARQLAERNAKANPPNKFRSAAPKGTKLAAGFTDRTKERFDDENDERAKRIKNLEELMKAGHLDQEMFDRMVQDITGGDIGATHLVKGLDRKLLERVRKGEDVFGGETSKEEDLEADDDLEDAFDELAEQDLGSIVREKAEKKGEVAPPKPVAGVKRSRADILAELKRHREEAAAAAVAEHEAKYPTLGKGFRRVNGGGESSRIEVDERGREVLVITDAQGKEKRKVRKQKVEESPVHIRHDVDGDKEPVNTHNPPPAKEQSPPKEEKEKEKEETEDDDIFPGIASNYNPLAGLDSDDDSEEEEEEGEAGDTKPAADATLPEPQKATSENESKESNTRNPATKRNYFVTSKTSAAKDVEQPSGFSTADAAVRAALQKVRTLDANSSLINDADSEEGRLKARLAKLTAADRDMEDIDMGFGESRFDDADEMEHEGEKIKFSEWKGLGGEEDDGEEEGGARGTKKRKRGPKKGKGDKNRAADVLKEMDRQKKGKTLG